MEGVLKYLMENYHILGVLVIVTVIAVKLFMTTRQAKRFIGRMSENPKADEILARLERIEQALAIPEAKQPETPKAQTPPAHSRATKSE